MLRHLVVRYGILDERWGLLPPDEQHVVPVLQDGTVRELRSAIDFVTLASWGFRVELTGSRWLGRLEPGRLHRPRLVHRKGRGPAGSSRGVVYGRTMTVPDSQIHDPLGWLEELRDALDDSAMEAFSPEDALTQEARRAAYRLAVAMGHCRLFGIKPPEDQDGTLPAAEAMAASEQLREFVAAWTEDARRLGTRWDEEEPEVGEALCAGVGGTHGCLGGLRGNRRSVL